VRFSPDNRRVIINTGPDISIREVGSWKLCHEIACACDAASGIAFTSDSRFAAVGLWGTGIRLIEVETGETVALLEAAREPPVHLDLNFSSDDTLLTAAVDHAGFCVWDMRVIRRRLAALGLDWDQPPLPEAAATGQEMPPLTCEIHLGELGEEERD
jgi:WD40 repeat protein